MQYWDIVARSFRISWRHKYLWLLALFSGEGGAGFSFSYSQSSGPGARGKPPDLVTIRQQTTTWITDHLGLIVLLAVLWIVLVIGFFILAAVCEGALVRGSAEHDAERPFGLATAWRAGVGTMGVIIRFRLLLIALGLPVVVVIFALFAGVVFSIVTNHLLTTVVLVLLGFLIVLAAIPYLIYLLLLDRLGARAAVLEVRGARASLVRGHRLLQQRLGRVLLVWVISIAVGFVVGIGLFIPLLIVALPLFIAGAAAYVNGSAALWLVIAIGGVVLLPLTLVIEGFVAAQSSTYWTLAFRRLELDQPLAYLYPSQPPPSTQGV